MTLLFATQKAPRRQCWHRRRAVVRHQRARRRYPPTASHRRRQRPGWHHHLRPISPPSQNRPERMPRRWIESLCAFTPTSATTTRRRSNTLEATAHLLRLAVALPPSTTTRADHPTADRHPPRCTRSRHRCGRRTRMTSEQVQLRRLQHIIRPPPTSAVGEHSPCPSTQNRTDQSLTRTTPVRRRGSPTASVSQLQEVVLVATRYWLVVDFAPLAVGSTTCWQRATAPSGARWLQRRWLPVSPSSSALLPRCCCYDWPPATRPPTSATRCYRLTAAAAATVEQRWRGRWWRKWLWR